MLQVIQLKDIKVYIFNKHYIYLSQLFQGWFLSKVMTLVWMAMYLFWKVINMISTIYNICMALIWATAFNIKHKHNHCFFFVAILLSPAMHFLKFYTFPCTVTCFGIGMGFVPSNTTWSWSSGLWDFYLFGKVPSNSHRMWICWHLQFHTKST